MWRPWDDEFSWPFHVEQLQSARRPKQSGWQLSPGLQVLCFGSLSVRVCRVWMRPRTDGVGVPPLFSQGGGLTFDDCALFFLYNHLELFKLSNFLRFLYFFHVHHRLCRGLGWLVGTQRRWVAALDPLQSLHAADFRFWFQRPAFFALRWLHNKNEMAYFHLSSCLIFAATVFIKIDKRFYIEKWGLRENAPTAPFTAKADRTDSSRPGWICRATGWRFWLEGLAKSASNSDSQLAVNEASSNGTEKAENTEPEDAEVEVVFNQVEDEGPLLRGRVRWHGNPKGLWTCDAFLRGETAWNLWIFTQKEGERIWYSR